MQDKEFKEYLEKKALVDELDKVDRDRAAAYAHDLIRGLKTIRTFPQGVTIFGSARLPETDKYYKRARKLGQMLAQHGHTVITGGGPSMMEAANRGAFEYGGRSIGLNITLEHEQHPNPYLTDFLEFEYFFARKVMLALSGKVYVFFPGGFGTLDEFSEVILLIQEGKTPRMPVFLFGSKFWTPITKALIRNMLPHGLIDKKDTEIFKITDSQEEIVAAADKIGHPMVGENYYDKYHKI